MCDSKKDVQSALTLKEASQPPSVRTWSHNAMPSLLHCPLASPQNYTALLRLPPTDHVPCRRSVARSAHCHCARPCAMVCAHPRTPLSVMLLEAPSVPLPAVQRITSHQRRHCLGVLPRATACIHADTPVPVIMLTAKPAQAPAINLSQYFDTDTARIDRHVQQCASKTAT